MTSKLIFLSPLTFHRPVSLYFVKLYTLLSPLYLTGVLSPSLTGIISLYITGSRLFSTSGGRLSPLTRESRATTPSPKAGSRLSISPGVVRFLLPVVKRSTVAPTATQLGPPGTTDLNQALVKQPRDARVTKVSLVGRCGSAETRSAEFCPCQSRVGLHVVPKEVVEHEGGAILHEVRNMLMGSPVKFESHSESNAQHIRYTCGRLSQTRCNNGRLF